MFQLSDIQQTCNKIAETFIYKTEGYNGCIITLRLQNENSEVQDAYYQVAYYARSNYKLVLGANSQWFFPMPGDMYKCLSYHDSAWRYAIEYEFENTCKNLRNISIQEIQPIYWEQIESIDRKGIYRIELNQGNGTIIEV